MKRPTSARLLLLSVTVAVALALAGSASAVEPTRETVTLHRVINPFVACPGFAVIGEFDLVREITTFYHEDGTPVKRVIYAEITGTVTNAVSGYSLPTAGVRIFHYDLTTGEFFTTGSNNFTKLPDGGVAIGGAGRLVFDAQGHLIEHDGPDSATEQGQLCAALA
jgi:hypothetical protein